MINKSAVACAPAGISRSATCVIAYLMAATRLCMDMCHMHVERVRSIVQPNEGFRRQLVAFDTSEELQELQELLSEKYACLGNLSNWPSCEMFRGVLCCSNVI